MAAFVVVCVCDVAWAGGDDAQRAEQYILNQLNSDADGAVVADARLRLVATENSRALSELQAPVPTGIGDYLKSLMQQQQIRDAVYVATTIMYRSVSELMVKLAAYLSETHVEGVTHVAVGVFGKSAMRVATVMMVRRMVVIDRLEIRAGKPIWLCGRVIRGVRPQVFVKYPQGAVWHRTWTANHRLFCAQVPTKESGRYTIEVLVDGQLGPEVAVLFPVMVGDRGDATDSDQWTYKIYPSVPSRCEEVEQRLLRLLNQARQDNRVTDLTADSTLAVAARRHSDDMLRRGYFGHRSPSGDSAQSRFIEAGASDDVEISENLAVASHPFSAHEQLLESPSHRLVMLSPQMRQVGVGVACDYVRQRFYVTQYYVGDDATTRDHGSYFSTAQTYP